MAVPKRKKSKSKRNMRRSHVGSKLTRVVSCPNCHEPVLPHHVCHQCGTYRGRTVIKVEEG